jgi:hypothetical protein
MRKLFVATATVAIFALLWSKVVGAQRGGGLVVATMSSMGLAPSAERR